MVSKVEVAEVVLSMVTLPVTFNVPPKLVVSASAEPAVGLMSKLLFTVVVPDAKV